MTQEQLSRLAFTLKQSSIPLPLFIKVEYLHTELDGSRVLEFMFRTVVIHASFVSIREMDSEAMVGLLPVINRDGGMRIILFDPDTYIDSNGYHIEYICKRERCRKDIYLNAYELIQLSKYYYYDLPQIDYNYPVSELAEKILSFNL